MRLPIDFRALVDELCRAKPMREGPDASVILTLFLERRAHTRNLIKYMNWEVNQEILESEVGKEEAKQDINDDDFEYLVERLIDRVEAEPPPHQAIPWILERTLDERAVEPAIRLLHRFTGAEGDYAQQLAGAALSILTHYQDRPEVFDAIEYAARHGVGHVGEQARLGLSFHSRDLSDAADDD